MKIEVDPEKLLRFAELASFMTIPLNDCCRVCGKTIQKCIRDEGCLGYVAREAYAVGGEPLQAFYLQLCVVLKVWKDGPPR